MNLGYAGRDLVKDGENTMGGMMNMGGTAGFWILLASLLGLVLAVTGGIVGKTYPLPDVPKAIRHLEEGCAQGKIAITV